ncbi:MAG: 50S ribosomal protein L5 [Planctomycetaceae bacterium]
MARLQDLYNEMLILKLSEKLAITNRHAVPRLIKIVVSMGVGKATQDRKRLEEAVLHLGLITGQKPTIRKSRIAVSAFRLRENMEIGCAVTLRGQRMYEFLDRFVLLALPRVRDFRGLNPKSFDGRGNYSTGLTEQTVFPEIPADKVAFTQGMNITFVTTACTDDQGKALLSELGIPFSNK